MDTLGHRTAGHWEGGDGQCYSCAQPCDVPREHISSCPAEHIPLQLHVNVVISNHHDYMLPVDASGTS